MGLTGHSDALSRRKRLERGECRSHNNLSVVRFYISIDLQQVAKNAGSLVNGDHFDRHGLQSAFELRRDHTPIPGSPVNGQHTAARRVGPHPVRHLVEDLIGCSVVSLARIPVERCDRREENKILQLLKRYAGQQVLKPVDLHGQHPIEIGKALLMHQSVS